MEELTKTELKIMKLLWQAGRPLSGPEILEISEGERSWKENSLYPTLQHLQNKGAIKVDGLTLERNKYSRTFLPCYSEETYLCFQLLAPKASFNIARFLEEYLQYAKPDDDTLKQLEEIISSHK